MSLIKRNNEKRETEIKNILRKKYPNGIDTSVISNYAKLAARVLRVNKDEKSL